MEQLRGEAPGEFGKLLGLDRIPEVRCLRRKLSELGMGEAAERWAAHLSREWMQADPQAAGTLYVDGHVRAYHGSMSAPPRRYVSRQRLCLRGISDYWVNDAVGQPFFVVEKTIDPGLLEALRTDIVPRLLREVRKLTESGHQVSLISTAFEVADTDLAARLFTRWCQENFFRYMMQHFALDLLGEHATAPLADTERVVNPAWRELNKRRNAVQGKLTYRHAKFAALTLHPEAETPSGRFSEADQIREPLAKPFGFAEAVIRHSSLVIGKSLFVKCLH